jgi:hypothetical protein
MCLASPWMPLFNTIRLLRVRIRNCVWRAKVFELLIGERESALLAHVEIVGGIHGKRTMQRLWHKHAWHTGHEVTGGLLADMTLAR